MSTHKDEASERRCLDTDFEGILAELLSLRAEIVQYAAQSQTSLENIHPAYHESAQNLLHYLALRRHDLRSLQLRLAELGLSSLGRAESHVLATIDAALRALHELAQRPCEPPLSEPADFARGERLLTEHTRDLLGLPPAGRAVRIMVTMPSEAENNYTLVHDLLQQGMDCMRINCAHDDAAAWSKMIAHLRRAEQALNKSCRIVMDLAGPKVRTGPLEPGPEVMRIRPQRDVYGRVVAPARVWLTAQDAPCPPPRVADASLPLPGAWLTRLRRGENLSFTDARGAKRHFTIVDTSENGCWVEATESAYVVPGTVLHHTHYKFGADVQRTAAIGGLPARANAILLHQNDLLMLRRDDKPGRGAVLDSVGRVLTPASIGCTLPAALDDVRAGEPIWFDDGKIGGVIEAVEHTHVLVRVTQVPVNGGKLRSDKGINLPESKLKVAALTEKDIDDLKFAAQQADVIELSFANSAADVKLLREHLAQLTERQPAVVLKIETQRAFQNLPAMLLAAMQMPCCGVMIARGDLAVECGFERLAEVQEEILWVCEAAHVPVIWATQVLERLATKGIPSRAEVSDAAMGHRAECVMLNKGPYILNAVRMLDDILQRMQHHQIKKRSMLRELRLAHSTLA